MTSIQHCKIRILLIVSAFILFVIPISVHASSPAPFGYFDPATNRTYVPVRYVSEQLQADVQWNPASRQVAIRHEDQVQILTIDRNMIQVNGEPKAIDAPPFIEDGNTYVPLRFVSEFLGVPFEYDNVGQFIHFHLGESEPRLPIINRNSMSNREAVTVESTSFTVNGRNRHVTMLSIDLLDRSHRLGVGLANGTIGDTQELKEIALDNDAIVAMNGTFFAAYTDSDYKRPFGDIVVDGEWVNRSGEDRTVFLFDSDHHVEFMSGADFRTRMQDGDVEGAIQAGPKLITDGSITVDPAGEGFRDPKILTQAGARSALGVTADHRLLLLTTSGATIPDLAEIMLQAGAIHAMNLDGGASSGLYYDGKYLTQPGRLLSNALLLIPNEE